MRYLGENLPDIDVVEAMLIGKRGIPALMEAGILPEVSNLTRLLYGPWFEILRLKISPKWGDLFFSLGGCFYV